MYSHHPRHLKAAAVAQHITSESVRQQWSDSETVTEKISKRWLDWLGHLARMPDEWIPKISLFSWMPELHPRGGPRKRGGMWSIQNWKKWRSQKMHGMKRQQHQEQSGELLIDRPVQTSPTENNIMSKQHPKYNVHNASVPSAATWRDTSVWGKGSNQFQSTAEPCSVQPAKDGSAVVEDSQSTHADQRPLSLESNSLALLPQLGVAWPNPAVKQPDRTGVCVSEQWARFEQLFQLTSVHHNV